jgi:hypothetical protein
LLSLPLLHNNQKRIQQSQEFSLKKVVSLPYGISINGQEDFNEVGEVINSLLDKRLRMLARVLVVYGELIRGQFLQDL